MWHPSVEEESWANVGRSTNALGARGSFHNLALYFEANGYLVEIVVCKMGENMRSCPDYCSLLVTEPEVKCMSFLCQKILLSENLI